VLATCSYGGNEIVTAFRAGNVCGAQFHPEKSGKPGLSILRRFLAL
jgi:imidazoleglycerol phosphate synthase glutamine amidotransferase subunit HisH